MKKHLLLTLITAFIFLATPGHVLAGGGSVGVAPGTGFTLRFASGGTDVYIPVQIRAQWYVDDEQNHAIGGEFGGDIGTGFAPNIVTINPYYHYYIGGEGNGGYVGAKLGLGFRSNFNLISVVAVGGYKYDFNDERFSIFGEGSVGFATSGSSFSNSRGNGGEFGLKVGGLFNFGN